jgi:hypothetical protein
MKQHNQTGKYIKKQDRLDAKKGKTFITPNNNEYTFDDYYKEGKKYIYVIGYKGTQFEVAEQDFESFAKSKFLTLDHLLAFVMETLNKTN